MIFNRPNPHGFIKKITLTLKYKKKSQCLPHSTQANSIFVIEPTYIWLLSRHILLHGFVKTNILWSKLVTFLATLYLFLKLSIFLLFKGANTWGTMQGSRQGLSLYKKSHFRAMTLYQIKASKSFLGCSIIKMNVVSNNISFLHFFTKEILIIMDWTPFSMLHCQRPFWLPFRWSRE